MTQYYTFLVWNLQFSCLDCHSTKERLTTDNPNIFICQQCNCYYTATDSWESGRYWSESVKDTHYEIRRSTDKEILSLKNIISFTAELNHFNFSGWLEKSK